MSYPRKLFHISLQSGKKFWKKFSENISQNASVNTAESAGPTN
jgi:hypothetical protein